MKRFVLAALFVLVGSVAMAQQTVPSPTPATTRLRWTHDGINTDGYRIFDGAVQVGGDLTTLTPVGTLYETAFPALTPGVHQLSVRAYNIAGSSLPSNVLAVTVVVVPSAPANLQIIVAEFKDGIGWTPVLKVIRS
jgi:hypothetical protein